GRERAAEHTREAGTAEHAVRLVLRGGGDAGGVGVVGGRFPPLPAPPTARHPRRSVPAGGGAAGGVRGLPERRLPPREAGGGGAGAGGGTGGGRPTTPRGPWPPSLGLPLAAPAPACPGRVPPAPPRRCRA